MIKLENISMANDSELKEMIETPGKEITDALAAAADKVRREHYGDEVYVRGLIEFTNYCKNNCYYCGIRRDNLHADRYRLTKEEILACCDEGYRLGFRTFVLQGGEDPYYTDDRVCEIVAEIHRKFPDCAITLSIGEKPRESYQAYFDAGAERYLLRHETAAEEHYGKLHPAEMSLANRKRCLFDLKEIGYQVGAGFMVDSPFQTTEKSGGRSSLFAGITAGYDRHRTVYYAWGDPVCGVSKRKPGKDAADGIPFAPVISVCADPIDDGARNDPSGGA